MGLHISKKGMYQSKWCSKGLMNWNLLPINLKYTEMLVAALSQQGYYRRGQKLSIDLFPICITWTAMVIRALRSIPPSKLNREKEEIFDRLQANVETMNVAKLTFLQQLRIVQMMTTDGQVPVLQSRYDKYVVNFTHFANYAIVAELISAPGHSWPTLSNT